MNRRPFKSLQDTHLRNTLKFARIFTTLGIVGFYITLAIAGFTYLQSSDIPLLNYSINQILSQGVLASFALLASGGALALIISIQQNSDKKSSLDCPLLETTHTSS